MTRVAVMRLGPYEIQSPLGAGDISVAHKAVV